jgi:hypothetical protein
MARENSPDDFVKPTHYRSRGMEAIDVIDAFGLNFNLGNVIKYVLRADRKVTDLLDWWLPRCFDPDAPVASAKTSVEIVLKLMGYKGDLLASMEEQDNKKGSQFVSLLQELTGDDTA